MLKTITTTPTGLLTTEESFTALSTATSMSTTTETSTTQQLSVQESSTELHTTGSISTTAEGFTTGVISKDVTTNAQRVHQTSITDQVTTVTDTWTNIIVGVFGNKVL